MIKLRWVAERPRRRFALTAVIAILATTLLPGSAAAGGGGGGGHSCEDRRNDTYRRLLECVTLAGVREHQTEFQAIANANDDPFYPGTRAAGTAGYSASVDYVAGLLEDAGYEVTLDPVEFEFNFPAVLRQTAPVTADYATGVFSGSGAAAVEGQVTPVDLNLEGDRSSTSGCQPEDFDGLDWSGDADIAVIQRGTCSFGTKASNAGQAGAEAVVIFNQGNTPQREALIVGDATSLDDGSPVSHTIPIVGASFADGVALSEPGSTAFVEVLPPETRTDFNVIAEKRGRNEDNVVMAGAHLDSVTEGPGINDNGSGSAALLETALMMADVRPQNTLRFGWWAAEELGLIGSTSYVNGLSPDERDRIALYMNYDMVGSPNYIFMAYDADESTFPAPDGVPIPEGSTAIEDLYESYYTMVDEPYEDSQFSGRSDYQAFIENGIPAGGLFTGAEVVKTEEQAIIWGGFTGEQFDPCYHEACDTLGNYDRRALEVNSDLIAFAQLTFAYSTESVNGVDGRRVPGPPVRLPPPAGPQGTFAGDDGGDGPATPTS